MDVLNAFRFVNLGFNIKSAKLSIFFLKNFSSIMSVLVIVTATLHPLFQAQIQAQLSFATLLKYFLKNYFPNKKEKNEIKRVVSTTIRKREMR